MEVNLVRSNKTWSPMKHCCFRGLPVTFANPPTEQFSHRGGGGETAICNIVYDALRLAEGLTPPDSPSPRARGPLSCLASRTIVSRV